MLRRTATALATTAALAGTAAAPAVAHSPGGASVPPARADHLTITVQHTGDSARDGTYSLRCHPTGGVHPQAQAACDAIDAATRGGNRSGASAGKAAGPFAPVSADSPCTMIYGGPETARIVGVWHGKPVDARFKRTNGCEIDRWNSLVPALPEAG